VVGREAITLAVVTWLPAAAAWGDAAAAAAVSALATSPTAAAALTYLIIFSFIGLPFAFRTCAERMQGIA